MRILVIDIETTSDTPDASICELGWCMVSETEDHGGVWEVGDIGSTLVDPGHPITPLASAVHHIVDEDVTDIAPAMGDAIQQMRKRLPHMDAYCAHNAKFERQYLTPFLGSEVPWICTYKAALRVWPDSPSHSNQGLRYLRKPEGLERYLANPAHRAAPDAYVTAFHLRDMLNAGVKIEQLLEWSNVPGLLTVCNIGKMRGKKWADIDSGFLNWLLDKDFDEDVKFTARHHLNLRQNGGAA